MTSSMSVLKKRFKAFLNGFLKLSVRYVWLGKVRDWLWYVFNNLRNSYPGAHRALPFKLARKTGIDLLWEGEAPEDQLFEGDLKYFKSGVINFTRPFVLNIREGRVIGKRGDVISPAGEVLTDVCPEAPRREQNHFLLSRGKTSRPQEVQGTVLLLNCGPYINYFHFYFDTISRLQFFNKLDLSVDYYCIARNTPFQKELAELFEIDESKIIPLEKDTHLKVENLIVSSLPGYNTNSELSLLKDYDTYRFIRNKILPKINKSQEGHAKLIYIKRNCRRTVINETMLLASLSKLGNWKIVCLENYSVLEQAAIFYHAEVIVATHGAGLSNIIYSRPGTTLVEIHNPNIIEPVYVQIARLFGLNYHHLIGTDAKRLGRKEEKAQEIWVNPEAVEECLKPILTKKLL